MSAPTVPQIGNGAYEMPVAVPAPAPEPRPFTTQSPHALPSHAPQQSRSVKRPRPVKSCTECRKRKLKCDRSCPCSQCQKSSRACRYATDHDGLRDSDGSDAETDGARAQKRPCHPTPSGDAPYHTPVKNGELSFEELVARVERLERSVARSPARTDFSGARMPGTAPPETIRGLTVKRGARSLHTRFFGQSSTRVLINLFDEARHYLANSSRIDGLREIFARLDALQKILREQHRMDTAPMTVFVDSMLPIQKRMQDILPPKAVCDRLLACYIDTNEIIYRMVHVPTIKAQSELYWENPGSSDDFLPQLLTVCAIGSRFTLKMEGIDPERREGVHIPTACALVRTWLDSLRGKHKVDFTTLQTEILLLHANRVMSLVKMHDTWAQLGYIVRMAMTMGMHRDPDEFDDLSPFHGELRRRMWFTILDMDLYISLACNLPCIVRDGDYTCRAPRNLNDGDITEDMTALPPGKPLEEHTDCQIQVYACMTLPLRVRVSHLVGRVDSIRDYGEVLEVGQRLDKLIQDVEVGFPRYSFSERQKSKEWRWRTVIDVHLRRPLLSLYRPFALGVPDAPLEIVRTYMRSSMVVLRYLDTLEPGMPHFEAMCEVYIQILRQDIIQAAFSICFYILNLRQGDSGDGVLGGAEAGEPGFSFASDVLMPGMRQRLVDTVQKSIDLLVRKAKPATADLKDVVPLVVAFNSARARGNGGIAGNEARLAADLRLVLEGVMGSTGTSVEELGAALGEGVGDLTIGGGAGAGAGAGAGEFGGRRTFGYSAGDTWPYGPVVGAGWDGS